MSFKSQAVFYHNVTRDRPKASKAAGTCFKIKVMARIKNSGEVGRPTTENINKIITHSMQRSPDPMSFS